MLKQSQRMAMIVVVLILFVGIVSLQTTIDPQRKQFEPSVKDVGVAGKYLPIEFALGAAVGFREAVAGLLWVRTDEFFHEGDYQAITPMIRIITWLDPHQIDVYETGAWHMDYNFTDADQRSDRRYIPLSIALMKEGIANNPDVPELEADLAFTHYFRKIGDYFKSADEFLAGQSMADRIRAMAGSKAHGADAKDQLDQVALSTTTLSHGLAHAYEATGQIDKALKQWQYCVATHQENITKGYGQKYGQQAGLMTSQKQVYEMQQRIKWRARDTKTPADVHFTAQLVRIGPRELVMKGTLVTPGAESFSLETGAAKWGNIDGCRVEIRLEDAGYHMPTLSSFSLSSLTLNANTTIMQDSASVRGGKFQRKIDMSQDKDIYSFTAPKYTVTLWFNPSNPNDCPINVQDRLGWLGEGLSTTQPFIDLTGRVPGDVSEPTPGLRMIKKVFTLTRDDIIGQGQKTFQ